MGRKAPLTSLFLGSAILPIENFSRYKKLAFKDNEADAEMCK